VLVWKTTGRNDALNWAAWQFREFVTEGLISDADASRLLEAASEFNGYTAKDGIRAVRATIASGLRLKQLETAMTSDPNPRGPNATVAERLPDNRTQKWVGLTGMPIV
jgi:hypothetical protein